jgi:hypothetical protein
MVLVVLFHSMHVLILVNVVRNICSVMTTVCFDG